MWEAIVDALGSSGETVLGVAVGGFLVVGAQLLSSIISSRATRSAAVSQAEAARDATEQDLRFKKADLLLDRQLAAVDQFLNKIEEWREVTELEWTYRYEGRAGDPPSEEYREATKLHLHMRRVLPREVTNTALTAIDAGHQALVHHAANYYTDKNDKQLRSESERRRIEALETFNSRKKAFMDSWQDMLFD